MAQFVSSRFFYPFIALVMLGGGVASGNAFFQDTLIMIFFWAAAAGAWNITGGYAGQFSLGHAAFMGLGAYASTLLYIHFHLSPWLGMILGALLAGTVAMFLGYITIRLKGPYFALGTLAIGQVLYILAVNWKKLTNGSEGLYIPFEPQIQNFIFEDKIPYLLVSVVIASIVFYICRFIETSRIGFQLVAIREDEDAARSLGVNPVRTKVFAFTASAILTAIPGTFYAQYIQFIEPASVLSLHFSIQIPLIAIIGGVGVSYGPFMGSLIIIPLSLFLRASLGGKFGAIHMALYGAVLVFVVIALQQGVAPAIRDKFFRKK